MGRVRWGGCASAWGARWEEWAPRLGAGIRKPREHKWDLKTPKSTVEHRESGDRKKTNEDIMCTNSETSKIGDRVDNNPSQSRIMMPSVFILLLCPFVSRCLIPLLLWIRLPFPFTCLCLFLCQWTMLYDHVYLCFYCFCFWSCSGYFVYYEGTRPTNARDPWIWWSQREWKRKHTT